MEAEKRFRGFLLDPNKFSQLSLGEKRALVHDIAQWSDDAPQILSSFTRRELLEIICSEMGKERKYSGYNKLKMIEHLLKLVSLKSRRTDTDQFCSLYGAKPEMGYKRKRQDESPDQLLTDLNDIPLGQAKEENVKILVCHNAACRASLDPADAFCKRCSCCICHHFDDNKDPTLWLTCESDCDENESCGMSCHLKCALEDERAGIVKSSCCTKLDGSFYCLSCRKINGLMSTWRKQLVVAKEARRVDVLCLRISLAHKILFGTEKYKEVQKTVESAFKLLNNEVGPVNLLCTKLARGIVNRLSCGTEVQKLCASSVEAFDSMVTEPCSDHVKKKVPASCQICFEELSPNSVIIVLDYAIHLLEDFLGCRVWHRKSTERDYPDNPTFIVLRPEKRFRITDLNPSTEYFCKVSLFTSRRTLGVWEAKWVSPASSENYAAALERGKKNTPLTAQTYSQVKPTNSSKINLGSGGYAAKLPSLEGINKSNNERLCSSFMETDSALSLASISPSTPCKSNNTREVDGSGFKRMVGESDYEYSVRVVKLLDYEGHIDEEFRVKFLIWFSRKATVQERRVVTVFVDVLIDDPPGLAEQLRHAFMDEICCEQKSVSWQAYCTMY
ncbi:PREDICTED: protein VERNALIZATION INSENSITIVE 3 [Theobroma cacao]|uniref:Protein VERNALIZATION INSENSITIVE 3 n=1 Tax=Theobroma cacao TaxID=3641 RepID=A0AB32UV46_THECC|nr:PREDICTED: protein VERNALIZATION INSENSITIVE 3 [Theobroma cacao]